MTIEKFVEESNLTELVEVEKACHLAYFFLRKDTVEEFGANECAGWFAEIRFARPNVTRLADRLKASPNTVRGTTLGKFRLQHSYVREMDRRFPHLVGRSQEVQDEGTILPSVLYEGTRGYLEILAKQINACFENNIFDGCAVLMRRFEEVLLILSYEKLGIAIAIKDASGNYVMLEAIVRNAEGNATLNLSRNSKTAIETIRKLGNYSAHKVTYTCKREYIKENINDFRALVDELLHKSGIRT